MTPEERAEKIKGSFSFNIGDNFILRELANEIAAEIRAAVEEEHQRFFKAEKAWAERWRKGVSLAYADAASLITTLLQKCGPNSDQRTTLERAKAVIEVRAAEVCK